MKFRYLLLFLLPLLVLGACGKKCDADKQTKLDDSVILKYLADKNIQAQKHSSGLYYQVISTGSGSISYTANTTVSTKYTGRLLDGSIFDSSSQAISFKLGSVISGWQVGIPLIQKGGKIRLFIPSGLAYGCDGQGSIPSNAVLDFDVELVNATN